MKCFELVKAVLEDTYSEIPGSDAEKDRAVNDGLRDMQQRFGKLTSGAGPNYAEAAVRFGYIYKYVTCHANLVCDRIRSSTALEAIFERPEVTLTCLGGGPGSDLVGVLKYLETSEKTPTVTANICDREAYWMDSWSDIGRRVDTDRRVFTNYLEHDACVSATWKTKKYLQADLVTLVFFMSELFSRKVAAEPYFRHVLHGVPAGAHVLFVDNGDSRFYQWFDVVARDASVQIVESDEIETRMPWDEQKKDLGVWATKFNQQVRLNAKIAYRVGRKT